MRETCLILIKAPGILRGTIVCSITAACALME